MQKTKALRASSALAIPQQQHVGMGAAGVQYSLHRLCDRASELLLRTGMLYCKLFKLGNKRTLVEQFDGVVARIGGREHAVIRMAKRAHHATAQCAMPEKQDCCKSSQK